jgi:hypothetical protein
MRGMHREAGLLRGIEYLGTMQYGLGESILNNSINSIVASSPDLSYSITKNGLLLPPPAISIFVPGDEYTSHHHHHGEPTHISSIAQAI